MSTLTPWEQAVAGQLAEHGAVNLESIGGVAAIPSDAVTSPLFPDVAVAILPRFPTLSDADQSNSVDLLCAAVDASTSGLTLRLLCDVVVPAAGDLGAASRLKDSLRQRVASRVDDTSSVIASIALTGLCHLALLQDDARFVLFDALGSVGADLENEVFARSASWVAGVAFDRWREPVASECLERLTIGEAEADASFWLGQTLLVAALERRDADTVRSAMRDSLEHFDRAAAQGEDRPDAVLYAATVRFITDYSVDTAPSRLAEHLNTAKTACHHYLVDGIGLPDLPSWMRPRYDAEARWVELLQRLQAATEAENRESWFEPIRMIDGLADAYTAAHTLTPARSHLSPDPHTSGIVETIVPRISSPFLDELAPLAFLDQWLAHTDHADAEGFREAVTDRVTVGVNRGKAPAAGEYPAVLRHLGAIPEADPAFLAQVESVLEDRDADRVAHTDRVVVELLNSLYTRLDECPDFGGEVREAFMVVVDQVIRFLHVRMNVQRGSADGRFAYLYDPNAHEKLLGADLRDFISGNVGVVHCEVQELAGGRTDLIVQFADFRITIELKREKGDVSPEGLAEFLPQLAAYESTDVALGMLVVLDLTDKPTGPANIRDNAWVSTVDGPSEGDRTRFAVVVRVPGNRRAPSSL